MFQQLKLTFALILFMSFCLESHAASDICKTCECKNNETRIDCSSRGLTSAPQPIPPNVVDLDLSYNDLHTIEAETFPNLFSLQTLDFRGNKIEEVNEEAFRNLSSLESLDFQDNKIMQLKAGTFQNLSKLTDLYLQYNDITEIEVGCFQNLPSLKTL
ncbi:leucine-rich repeat-containing protein 4-like isoform X2 [Octopus sinensis]|uniref:Leucine-rich repeat-containing protein 4-like isoform X2 n=1 Tax=Octopus sinensis TaxID=2607531 RepID=A0A7E6FPR9_9MOLL|nr:leucine-rich repeat-containing protein 4-like isoform X2 [Octopus sinensis]